MRKAGEKKWIAPIRLNKKILQQSGHNAALSSTHTNGDLLGSFNGPEPCGMESTIRKWKRDRGWYPLVYAEDQLSPWHRTCIAHEGTRRPVEGVLEARAEKWAQQVSTLQRVSQKKREREKERERDKKDPGTEALMKHKCFNDFPMSIYRLWYKKLLSGMIEIKKPKVQQLLPREQGVMLVTRSGHNPYLKKGEGD